MQFVLAITCSRYKSLISSNGLRAESLICIGERASSLLLNLKDNSYVLIIVKHLILHICYLNENTN